MGFYYGPSKPPEEKEPGGCMEALILTRAAFGALALPIGILFGAIGGLVLVLYLFTVHVLLGLLALVGAVRCLLTDRSRGLALLPLAGGVQLLLYAALDGPLYRYRAPLEPLITLLAVGGLALLAAQARALIHRLRPGPASERAGRVLANRSP